MRSANSAAIALAFGTSLTDAALPKKFFNTHHHLLDTANNTFSTFLQSLLGNMSYLPENYAESVVEPVKAAGVEWLGSIHMEALPGNNPGDGPSEVAWLQSLVDDGKYDAKGIVGSCDLSADDAMTCLTDLKAASPLLVGVRWVLLRWLFPRNGGKDLLQGGVDGGVLPSFEKGYAALADHNLTFDMQCEVNQLPSFFELASRYPDIPVCINHLGRPAIVWGVNDTEANQTAISEWRTNMKAMASLSHVYVKISMLGHIVPNWIADEDREALVKQMVLETVALFGPERCIVNFNWWLNAAVSDSDFFGSVGPEPVEFLQKTMSWFQNYTEEEKEWLYWKSAETFYLRTDEDKGSKEEDKGSKEEDKGTKEEDKGTKENSLSCSLRPQIFLFATLASATIALLGGLL
eukprot:CAMPEP_0183292366 /NCGR_PEP_ID=MMETSP0160_2-20130417/1445_1 /TAXON_ID=2839 ORGANISM="Odontella Sinensis, Strain Grunow 1884" /NCGR_SAMPLE_ID=MMETSP0160_2 /ASSEMBLY_ACC=CAM_ASM_000250 /LENGTH=405 /DNA_ID=CAMNT_0025453303 /DNA_START=61 /DNA_END=1278 /DNA_ORIENTATION=-